MTVSQLLATLSDIGQAQTALQNADSGGAGAGPTDVAAHLYDADVRALQQLAQSGTDAQLWTDAACSPTDIGRYVQRVVVSWHRPEAHATITCMSPNGRSSVPTSLTAWA